jgi:hypothetical protein
MRRLMLLCSVLVALLMIAPAVAPAKGGVGFSGGGGRSSGGGGGIKSSGGSSSSSSAPKAGSGGVRQSTPSQPSSGAKAQPAPAARMVPRSLPPNVRTPVGRNFNRDRAALARNPRYLDPYDGSYYGNPQSPYFYMYLASLNDNDPGNNPQPYQVRCKQKGHSTGIVVLWAVLALILGLVIGAICALASRS